MGAWSGNKTDKSNINNGNEYERRDRVTRQSLNSIVNNSLYSTSVVDGLSSAGEYNPSTTYQSPNIVLYSGDGYMAIYKENGAIVPFSNKLPTNTTYWRKIFDGAGTIKYDEEGTVDNVTALYSNPNLLINGDFRINQRGEVNYTNDTSATKYTVDRWRMSLGNTGLNGTVITPKQNGGVNITCSNAYLGGATPFIQLIENPQNLIGKTLTFSIYCSAITSGSCRFRLSNYDTFATGNLQVGINQISYTVPEGTTQLFCGIICNATTAFDIDLDYVKLEVGNVATPFSPRPYAEELALCQRYYINCSGASSGISNLAGTQLIVNVPVPTTIRQSATYNLVKSGTPLIRGNGSSISVNLSDISFSGRENNQVQIFVASTLTSLSVYYLQGLSITVDAEIY